MNITDIRNLLEYNHGANDVLLEMLAAAFGEDAALSDHSPTADKIKATAVHILGALQIWRTRWEGTSPTAMLDPAPYPTVRHLRNGFDEERESLRRFIDTSTTDSALEEMIAYSNTRGEAFEQPLGAMMQHVVNHSSYHRGQITAMLMALGFDDVIQSTDFSTWTLIKHRR